MVELRPLPPPYPDPKEWSKKFKQAQRGCSPSRWLTPCFGLTPKQKNQSVLIDEEISYGFVLTKEWKGRLKNRIYPKDGEAAMRPKEYSANVHTTASRVHQQETKISPVYYMSAIRCHLWAFEASLNVKFDNYVDSSNPNVWPATAFKNS